MLLEDTFAKKATYTPIQFRHRFQMHKLLFLPIVQCIHDHGLYFHKHPNALGSSGLTPLQKCTSPIRTCLWGMCKCYRQVLSRLSETSDMLCLTNFCDFLVVVYCPTYMRRANMDDVRGLLKSISLVCFPGMLRSINRMH